MPSFCQNLKTRYEHLQILTDAFTVEYMRVKDSDDLTQVKVLGKELEEAKDALLEPLITFTVPGAPNPYEQALLDTDVDQQRIEMVTEIFLDLRQEIQRQTDHYKNVNDKDGNPVLQAWVEDIIKNKGLIYAEVVKDRLKIIERIKEGMIPIVMPSRAVQMKSWEAALIHLKPIKIKNGGPNSVTDTDLYDLYKTDPTNKMSLTGFFKDIPDRPYLVWTKPSQMPDKKTCNASFPDQIALYKSMVIREPDLYDQTDLVPTEYMALQAIFTLQARDEYKKLQGEAKESATIRPLDCDSFTHFLSAETFSDGNVPHVDFSVADRKVYIGHGHPQAHSMSGFRPASRT